MWNKKCVWNRKKITKIQKETTNTGDLSKCFSLGCLSKHCIRCRKFDFCVILPIEIFDFCTVYVEIAFWGLLFWVNLTGRIAYCQKWIWLASWDQITLLSKHRRLGMKECCAGRQQNCKSLLSAEGLCLSCCLTALQTLASELWKPKVSCKCSNGKYKSVECHFSVVPPFSGCSLLWFMWQTNS